MIYTKNYLKSFYWLSNVLIKILPVIPIINIKNAYPWNQCAVFFELSEFGVIMLLEFHIYLSLCSGKNLANFNFFKLYHKLSIALKA